MVSEQVADSIWTTIKEKYHLPVSNVSATAKIIGLIFLGELPIKNFIASLKNELGVDVATAQAIAQDINQAIFQPVRNSLMAVHGLERGSTPNNNAPAYRQAGINADNNQVKKMEPQPNNNYEVQQRREEIIKKIRPVNNEPPPPRSNQGRNSAGQAPPARPASYTAPRRNVVNLRNIKRKGKYNGFFT